MGTANATHVLLYEPLSNHNDTGANFLFADGHVEWLDQHLARKVIRDLQSGKNPPPSIK